MNEPRRRALWLFYPALLAACGGNSSGAGQAQANPAIAAKAHFWQTFQSKDFDAGAAANAEMMAAFQTNPDEELARLIGMGLALQGREAPFTGSIPNPEQLVQGVQEQGTWLATAMNLSADPRSRALNTTQYSQAPYFIGALGNDPALEAVGLSLMDQVVAEYPVMGNLAKAAHLTLTPAGGADFASCVESFFKAYEACLGAPIDRQSPDWSGLVHLTTAPDIDCGNPRTDPHGIQGNLFLFADTLVKNGQLDAGYSLYREIEQTDGYATWTFQEVLASRLSADLSQLQKTFVGNGGPLSAPLGASGCYACHAN